MELPSHEAGGDRVSESDADLRNAAIQSGSGREAAWTALVSRHGPALKRAIEGVLLRNGRSPDASTVEDLVESTWFRITKRGSKKLRDWNPHNGASLGTHFVTIGMGEALTWCRFRETRREVMMSSQGPRWLAEMPAGDLTPEQTAWLNEAEVKLREWEGALERADGEVLRLWREGYSQAAIARALHRSQQLVSRTLTKLKAMAHQLIEDLIA